jgi:heme-degrading monooxygenase HmoA
MDYYFWMTTRTTKPGSREEFDRAVLEAGRVPGGLVGAYVLYAADGDEVVGTSIWDSAEACHRYVFVAATAAMVGSPARSACR